MPTGNSEIITRGKVHQTRHTYECFHILFQKLKIHRCQTYELNGYSALRAKFSDKKRSIMLHIWKIFPGRALKYNNCMLQYYRLSKNNH